MKPFQRCTHCENGHALGREGRCLGTCAYHGARQRLIYEFVNLDARAMQLAVGVEARWITDDRDDILGHAPAIFRCWQNEGRLSELWNAVQREGGDLAGECPF